MNFDTFGDIREGKEGTVRFSGKVGEPRALEK